MQPVEKVLSRLQGAKQNHKNQWAALCPAHDDQHPSLSISLGDDGRILLHCHSGCRPEEVVRALGLEMSNLFPESHHNRANNSHRNNAKPTRKIIAEYDYTDAEGHLLYQIVRYEPRSFSARRPDDKGGWINSLNGVRLILYRLPEVIQAIKSEQTVFVVEGEKDVESLCQLGLVATCNPFGAEKWRDEYSESLRGGHIVILPDKDAPGRKHAEQVAHSVYGHVASLKVLELPGSDKDVTEWLQAGRTKEELVKLVEQSPDFVPKSNQAAGVESQEEMPYRETPRGFERLSEKGWEPLTNFTVKIDEERIFDDGEEKERYVVGRILHEDRTYPWRIASGDYGDDTRLRRSLFEAGGAKLYLAPSQSAHLRPAISLLNQNHSERLHYAHTGWREGKFLLPDCFIDAKSRNDLGAITVAFPTSNRLLARYGLAHANLDPQAACQALRDFLKIAPRKITLTLLAHAGYAPLANLIPGAGPYALWLSGETGLGKSSLIAAAMNLFGRFTRDDLETWRSTANEIEKLGFYLKDVLYPVDDFKARDVEIRKVTTVIQNFANRQGRGRLRADASFQKTWHCRGVLLCSGEDLPTGESSVLARMLVLPVAERVNFDALNKLDMDALAGVMVHYLSWLAKQSLKNEDLLTRVRQVQCQFPCTHERIAESCALNALGLHMLLKALTEMGVVSAEEVKELHAQHVEVLLEIAKEMSKRTRSERYSTIFLETLRSLIASGQLRLSPDSQGSPEHNNCVGWCDEGKGIIYIIAERAFTEVTKALRDQGTPLGASKQVVYDQLDRDGLLAITDHDQTTVRRPFAGTRTRVRVLAFKAIEFIDTTPSHGTELGTAMTGGAVPSLC